MTVRELREKLALLDQDAEVHYPQYQSFVNDSVEIHEIVESESTYGILTPNPRTVKCYVLCTGTETL